MVPDQSLCSVLPALNPASCKYGINFQKHTHRTLWYVNPYTLLIIMKYFTGKYSFFTFTSLQYLIHTWYYVPGDMKQHILYLSNPLITHWCCDCKHYGDGEGWWRWGSAVTRFKRLMNAVDQATRWTKLWKREKGRGGGRWGSVR